MDGSVIDGTMTNPDRPVRWKLGGGFQLLGDLPGDLGGGAALAVSADGPWLIACRSCLFARLGPRAQYVQDRGSVIGWGIHNFGVDLNGPFTASR